VTLNNNFTPAREKQGTHTITKQYNVQNTTAAPKKEKKQTVKYSRFLQCIQLECLKMADWGRNM
jgi:hypothetical protein